MRKIYALFVLLLTLSAAQAGNITTVAGDGTAGYTGDGGSATAAWLNFPDGLALDAVGNLYIADKSNHRIRKLSTTGIITTIAGTGSSGFTGDGGQATAARLNNPVSVAVDATGNVYISDYSNSRIRKINTSGIITTVAGTGTASFTGDGGPATAATFNGLAGIAVRNNDVYIADKGNNRIRKIAGGTITTIAGTTAGYSGDYGAATAARLNQPNAVAIDANGALYIADWSNFRIRKVDTFGTITTIGGSGSAGYSGDGGPATAAAMTQPFALATDRAGNIYVSFGYNHVVRRIATTGTITSVIGTGSPSFGGDGGPATVAFLNGPAGIAIDDVGNTFIADATNQRIRYVEMNNRPLLTGGRLRRFHVCQNATAVHFDSLAITRDTDTGQTLTWSMGRAPLHGTATGSYTTAATGGTITPTGLVYTPDYGFYGTDTFSLRVTDGLTFDTALVITDVVRLPIGGYIMGADSICPGGHQTFADTSGTPGGRWSHTDTFIVLDSITGYMTGITPGSENVFYTVTNSCGTASASLHVTVNAAPISGAIVGADSVCVGASITLTNPTATPGGDWESGDTTIARINSSGVVRAFAGGIVYISYNAYTHCGSAPAYHRLVVSPNPGVITGADSLCPGGTIVLANATTGGVWSSGTVAVATISTTGSVYGVTPGAVTISYTVTTVSCGMGTAIKNLTVVAPPTAGSVSGASSLCAGTSIVLSASVAGGHWFSADTTVAVIDSVTGLLTGRAAGVVSVRYSVVNFCGTATTIRSITVSSVPAVPVITAPDTICLGSPVTVSGSPAGGTWALSNTLASLSSATAATPAVTGSVTGSDTLIYTVANTCGTTSANHHLQIATLPAHGYIVGAHTLCQANAITLTDSVTGGTWGSGTAAIATISTAGVVTGRTAGSAIISYSITNICGAIADTHHVTVLPLPTVTISGAALVCEGDTIILTAFPSGGSWANLGANTSVAAGVITGIHPGADTITYIANNSCGSDTGYYALTVQGAPAISAVTGPAVICAGATATFTDSTVGGTWSSSNATIASIGATGVASALLQGTAIISYSVSNVCFTTTDTLLLTVITLPVPAIVSGPSAVCQSAGISLSASPTGGSWSNAHGFISIAGGAVTGLLPGLDTVYYSLTNSCGTTTSRHLVNVLPLPVPGVISGPSVVCPGTTITLTDTPSGGVWSVVLGFVTVSGGLVTGIAPGADTVLYTVTNSCGSATARKVIVVAPYTSPSVVAIATPDTVVCQGDMITLTAHTTSGGASPFIQWYKGGAAVATGVVFTTYPASGDVFWCKLVSSDACALRDTVVSDTLSITVIPVVSPSVLLSVSPNDTVTYHGEILTFTVHAINCRGVPVYRWFVNGNMVAGATDSVYSVAINGNDSVYCVVTCSGSCVTTPYNRTNTIIACGTPLGLLDITRDETSFFVYPNPNNGTFLLSGIYEGGLLQYSITDITGREVKRGETSSTGGVINQNITLNGVMPGTYMVDIVSGNTHKKLIFSVL